MIQCFCWKYFGFHFFFFRSIRLLWFYFCHCQEEVAKKRRLLIFINDENEMKKNERMIYRQKSLNKWKIKGFYQIKNEIITKYFSSTIIFIFKEERKWKKKKKLNDEDSQSSIINIFGISFRWRSPPIFFLFASNQGVIKCVDEEKCLEITLFFLSLFFGTYFFFLGSWMVTEKA